MDDLSLTKIFCQPCSDVLTDGFHHGWDRATQQYKHFRTGLDQPFEDRCWLCIHLFESHMSKKPPNCNEAHREVGLGSYSFRRLTDSRGGQRRILEIQLGDKLSLFEISIQSLTPDTEILSKARMSLAESWTGGEHTVALAADWLSTCLKSHVRCNKMPLSNWRPSRLLEITDERIRLILANTGTELPYATLSHCWGKEKFLVLNSKTLPYFLTGIPASQFPLTFQHAIKVVRTLGVKYLWIDCYCIIQGTDGLAEADWATESGQMSQIYSNSLINIGAAHANGPHEGLFATRRPQRESSFPFKFSSSEEFSINWYVLTKTDISWSPLQRAFLDLYESPLMKRAWVLQECVLSTRMISFTKAQLFWQCSESAACEIFPSPGVENDDDWTGQYPFWALTQPKDLHIFNITSSSEYTNVKNDLSGLQERWFNTLETYSQASLTYPDKDILKAIEGVGKSIANITRDTYIHGILQKTLPQALLWYPLYNKVGCFNRSGRAPTWHWASYDGGVSFLGPISLNRRLRTPSEWNSTRFYPFTYVFLSSSCSSLDMGSGIGLWPYIICISRVIKVRLQVDINHEGERCFSAITSGHVQLQNISIDDNDSIDASLNGTAALLPLIISQTTNLRTGNMRSRFELGMIDCLLVQDMGKGTLRRVGTCVQTGTGLLEETSKSKPRFIVLC